MIVATTETVKSDTLLRSAGKTPYCASVVGSIINKWSHPQRFHTHRSQQLPQTNLGMGDSTSSAPVKKKSTRWQI
jgi:hypothetical protein